MMNTRTRTKKTKRGESVGPDQNFSELITSLGAASQESEKDDIQISGRLSPQFYSLVERLRHQFEDKLIWRWVKRIVDDIERNNDPAFIVIDAYNGPLAAGMKGRLRKNQVLKLVRAAKPVILVMNTEEGRKWMRELGHTIMEWLLTL